MVYPKRIILSYDYDPQVNVEKSLIAYAKTEDFKDILIFQYIQIGIIYIPKSTKNIS